MKETNQHIAEYLMQSHGIDITMYDDAFLEKIIQHRMVDTHCFTIESYATFLKQNSKEIKDFLKALQNSYSEFFRNPLTYAVLERIILPLLNRQKHCINQKELRIWSAACASGQESYSLAILLEELKNGCNEKINYRIFATDQNQAQINEAQKGHFPPSSLNNVSLKRINQWFCMSGKTYGVSPKLKEHITFSVFDLFNNNFSSPPASIFGNFDIVVCANLLFYYKPMYRKIILEKAENSLATGGYLIVGETEREILMEYNYKEVFSQSGIFKIMERG